MISLWKTANDLDRLDELQRVAIDCYALCLSTTAQYAVEADRAQVSEFRQHLVALEALLREPATAENLKKVAASYRGELREYRDQAHRQLERLRQEVSAAATAMKVFAEGVASNSVDHEEKLEGELKNLQTLSKSDNLDQIRGGIRVATNCIAASVDQMRRSNQLMIAQMQDEIRALHQEMQAERRALNTDRSSGAWNRQKIETRIEELLRQDDPFCLLVVGMRGFKQLDRLHSQTVIAGALKAVFMRFQAMLGEDVLIGRWTDAEFVAILPMEPSDVMAISREVTRKLSGTYSVQENGLAQAVSVQMTAGIVDRRAGQEAAKFHKQLEQMSAALTAE